MRNYILVLSGVVLLSLCSCSSRTAQVGDFGKSLNALYVHAGDGSEYVTIHGDMTHNSALVMPKISFAVEADSIHIDATLALVKRGKNSLTFPWRIPLHKGINRITFGPENEIIWQRKK